jgi:NosR/NirI family transcriptional regulator, nitrous oxide reductase regulator
MIASSLFVERAFCRYLCPLGAAMAIPARLRLFDWLRRYRECGNPCHRCANECPVQAIHPEGLSTRTSASSACIARCSTITIRTVQ